MVSSLHHRRRRSGFLLAFLSTIAVLAVFWVGGLVWYAAMIPAAVDDADTYTDAIVVLTGGKGRLVAALDLLERERADRLFVSGVYRGVDVKTLLRVFKRMPSELESHIGLGDAINTAANATESAVWIRDRDIASIRLVTASYHMPRSLLEFRHALPDITIVPHPIFSENVKQDRWWAWPGTAMLIAREYSKYLLARVRHAGDWLRPDGGSA
jgi:uncharacterized SAM-binding protein YcdF (DUF218 family)